jgi:hypothetical protein
MSNQDIRFNNEGPGVGDLLGRLAFHQPRPILGSNTQRRRAPTDSAKSTSHYYSKDSQLDYPGAVDPGGSNDSGSTWNDSLSASNTGTMKGFDTNAGFNYGLQLLFKETEGDSNLYFEFKRPGTSGWPWGLTYEPSYIGLIPAIPEADARDWISQTGYPTVGKNTAEQQNMHFLTYYYMTNNTYMDIYIRKYTGGTVEGYDMADRLPGAYISRALRFEGGNELYNPSHNPASISASWSGSGTFPGPFVESTDWEWFPDDAPYDRIPGRAAHEMEFSNYRDHTWGMEYITSTGNINYYCDGICFLRLKSWDTIYSHPAPIKQQVKFEVYHRPNASVDQVAQVTDIWVGEKEPGKNGY